MLAAVRSIAAKMSGNCFCTRAIAALVSLLGRCPVIPTRSVRRGFGGCDDAVFCIRRIYSNSFLATS
jgi:hypothetical protein